MFDAKRILDQLVGSGVAGGLAGGVAGVPRDEQRLQPAAAADV